MLNLDRTLYVDKREPVKPIFLRRGEKGLTTINAVINNIDGAYDLTGCSVRFCGLDAKKHYIISFATITNAKEGKISYTVDNRLTGVAGETLLAYFEITKSGNIITTNTIPIVIHENVEVSDTEAEEYESQISELLDQIDSMMSDVNGLLDDINTATRNANTATSNANDATENANNAASNANTATANANSARDAANEAATNANAARDAANKATSDAISAENERVKEWEKLQSDSESATLSANDAANSANTAASTANSAAERTEAAINGAKEAADYASKSAENVTNATNDALAAAADAVSAASASREATALLNNVANNFETITGSEIAYACGESSVNPPTEGWTAGRQSCPQGMYEWVRTTTHYLKNPDKISYAVAYQGKDGRDGITTEIGGMYWFNVEDGDLFVYYHDTDNPPEFQIIDGDLYTLYDA